MRSFSRNLAGCFLILMLVSCSTPAEETAIPTQIPQPTRPQLPTAAPTSQGQLPKLTGDWQIKLTQSGGIMGMSRALEVNSAGKITVTDLRSKKSSQGQLPAGRLAALVELVAGSVYKPAAIPAGCADCFIFEIEIASDGGKFQVQLNQIDLEDSGLQALVTFLGETLKTVGK